MSLCVVVDAGGFVVEAAEVYPDCTEYALLSPEHFERLTYWADVSIALDPTGTDLYLLMSAILLVFVTAWGIKQIARLILNR